MFDAIYFMWLLALSYTCFPNWNSKLVFSYLFFKHSKIFWFEGYTKDITSDGKLWLLGHFLEDPKDRDGKKLEVQGAHSFQVSLFSSASMLKVHINGGKFYK